MILSRNNYHKLLKSEEYAPYLMFNTNDRNISINIKILPKDYYLPVDGDYFLGIELAWEINKAMDLGCNTLPIRVRNE